MAMTQGMLQHFNESGHKLYTHKNNLHLYYYFVLCVLETCTEYLKNGI